MSEPRRKRVIVVGAGIHGIAVAKTYLQIDPEIDISILDSNRTVGGVWSKECIYPGLMSQQQIGLFEFSDMPMDRTGIPSNGYVPAIRVHEYLEAYIDKFDLRRRIQFGTRVERIARDKAENYTGGWLVYIAGKSEALKCDQLCVATGFTSMPNMPEVFSSGDFDIPVFHSKYIPQYYKRWAEDAKNNPGNPEIKRVVVYGGGKSAVDCIQMACSLGKTVDWVIREEGKTAHGPPAIAPGFLWGVNLSSIIENRFAESLSPNVYDTNGRAYRFLHSGTSTTGTWFMKKFWNLMGKMYRKEVKDLPDLKTPLQNGSGFWVENNGIITQMEVFDYIRDPNKVRIHRATIDSMSGKTLILTNGTTSETAKKTLKNSASKTLETDAVICATGWKQSFSSLFSKEDCIKYGLPVPWGDRDVDEERRWNEIEKQEEALLLEEYPYLADSPRINSPPTKTPPRLHKHRVPLCLMADGDNSLIFQGLEATTSTFVSAEVSALWSAAWLTGPHGAASRPCGATQNTLEPLEREISRTNVWMEKRYGEAGRGQLLYLYDTIGFVDMLLKDMGMPTGKKGSIREKLKFHFGVVRPSDYASLVSYWIERKHRNE